MKTGSEHSAISSGVEHLLHTQGVAGSNPASRTIFQNDMNLKSITFLPALFLCLSLLTLPHTLQAQGKKDAWLKKIAPLVKPTPFSKSSLGKVQGQMIRIISVVALSDRTDGPKPNELITRACETHPDYGPMRTIITANIVERAYEDAMYLGLFNDKGRFTNVIKNGPDVGEKIKFEYIVSPEKAPEFSQDIANIRIVLANRERQAKIADRVENVHLQKLKTMQQETRNRLALRESESNHLLDTSFPGPDKGPHYEKWEAAMEVAGEASKEPAEIKLEARKRSSASRNNGDKMSIWAKINNLSNTPTKVTVHCYIFGRTERKKILFKIVHTKKEVVLLPYDEQQMLHYSPPLSSLKDRVADLDGLRGKERGKAKYFVRGWIVRVEHNGKAVAKGASMSNLLLYADDNSKELNALP